MLREVKLPVRGEDAVEILLNDHEVLRQMLQQLTQTSKASQRKQTLEELKGALTIHNATEENLVYPALREIARKKAESQHLYQETSEADVLVFQLDTLLKEGEDDAFTETAEKLQAAILEHMDDEENSAFPHLREKAEADQAEMLTDAVRQFRGALHYGAAKQAQTRTGTLSDGDDRDENLSESDKLIRVRD